MRTQLITGKKTSRAYSISNTSWAVVLSTAQYSSQTLFNSLKCSK